MRALRILSQHALRISARPGVDHPIDDLWGFCSLLGFRFPHQILLPSCRSIRILHAFAREVSLNLPRNRGRWFFSIFIVNESPIHTWYHKHYNAFYWRCNFYIYDHRVTLCSRPKKLVSGPVPLTLSNDIMISLITFKGGRQ